MKKSRANGFTSKCILKLKWGKVYKEKTHGSTFDAVIRLELDQSAIARVDSGLVWKVLLNTLGNTNIVSMIDDSLYSGWHEGQTQDLRLNISKRWSQAHLDSVMTWLQSGEACKIIELGLEVVRHDRGKAVEIELLEGSFYHLHPEQMISMAAQHGVRPSYVDQMKSGGFDIENWPLSVIPTCPVKDGGRVESEAGLDGFWIMAHARPQPLIRTTWGWLTLETGRTNCVMPAGGIVVSVSAFESMEGIDEAPAGMQFDDDFDLWFEHFVAVFPFIGKHVELVESIRHYQTFSFWIDGRHGAEGWSELLGWLATGVLDKEIERFATAKNLDPGVLASYFEQVSFPVEKRSSMLALVEKVFRSRKARIVQRNKYDDENIDA